MERWAEQMNKKKEKKPCVQKPSETKAIVEAEIKVEEVAAVAPKPEPEEKKVYKRVIIQMLFIRLINSIKNLFDLCILTYV